MSLTQCTFSNTSPPKLLCSVHPSYPIIKFCKCCHSKKAHFLLCEKCISLKEPISHQDHNKMLLDLDKFIETCYNNFSQILDEEKEAKQMFLQLEELLLEAADKEEFLSNLIDKEIAVINQDFEELLAKIDNIKQNIEKTKEKFVKTLADELKEMKKLKEDLQAFADEGSPLLKRKSIGELEKSLRNLQTLCESHEKQGESDFVLEVFGTLAKEIKRFESNFELNYQKDYKEELQRVLPSEKQMSKREASAQIANLINEIRNKASYPPKYKQYQNSKEEFDKFLRTLDTVFEQTKEISEILLLTQHEVIYKFTGENAINSKVSFASNNISLLLKSSAENVTRIPQSFDIATSIKTDHRKGITCLCVYNQQYFITGGNDSLIKLWDLYTFKCSKNLKCETVPYSIMTMTDCNNTRLLISGHAQGYVAVFNEDFDLRWVFKKQESIISSLICLGDFRTILSASYDATILIIDVMDGVVLKKLAEHEASVNCLGYSRTLSKWASGSDDGRILIWDIQKDPSKHQMSHIKEQEPDYFKNEGTLDSIDSEPKSIDEEKEPEEEIERVSMLETPSFHDAKTSQVIFNGEEVKHLVFSQNNPRVLISTCYNLIKVWDIETRSCLIKLGKHEKTINRILIIEETLLKKSMNFGDYKRGRAESLSLNSQTGMKFFDNNLAQLMSIDKLMILSFGSDHMIRLWNAGKHSCLCENYDHIKEFSLKDSLENSILMYNEKDERAYFLSVGDKDNIINIWKLK